MSFPVQRVDQLSIVISNPTHQVRHYTIAEIKGEIINSSSEELYIGSKSWGFNSLCGPGIPGKVNPNIPSVVSAHSTTGEIRLLTLEINIDAFDAVENMTVGNFSLEYHDSSGTRYRTAPALFHLILQQ